MPAGTTQQPAERLLKLRAEDSEDMAIIAACLQDAVVARRDMTYLTRQRRFAMVMSRYCWEDDVASQRQRRGGGLLGRGRRIRSGLHIDGVMKVDTLGLPAGEAAEALSLLTIAVEPGEDASATLLLMFAGGGIVRLAVECIECRLADIGPSWPTPRQPRHSLDETPPARRGLS